MNFHLREWILSWIFVRIFSVDFLGPSIPLNEGPTIHREIYREIYSKIHGKIPAKSTKEVKNGIANSALQEESPKICTAVPPHLHETAASLLLSFVKQRETPQHTSHLQVQKFNLRAIH